LHFLSQP